MADFTLTAAPLYPIGTTVSLYRGQPPVSGSAPPNDPVSTGHTVGTDGQIDFTDLAGGDYFVYAVINGSPRFMHFKVEVLELDLENFATLASLAGSQPTADAVIVKGLRTVGDGGWGLWRNSTTLGVRGKPTVTNQGAGLPNGEYRVLLTGGGGTGASARVIISGGVLNTYQPAYATSSADYLPDAIILEPGSGYTSAPSLSTNQADWFVFHSNNTPATFGGSPTMPVVTFALADDRLSVRTANAKEYLLEHEGRVNARQLGIKCSMSSTTDAKYLQEGIRALLTGRSQIVQEYGGGPSAGGLIEFPAAPVPLENNTIYVNSTGTPNGTEVVGIGFSGAVRGSARTTRPDGAHSGTVFQYGLISIGDRNTDGVFETVTRGIVMERFQLIGGMEWWGVQHAFNFSDVLINPDSPVGTVKSGVRVDGYGLKMAYCSTGLIERVFVTGGDQTYFGTVNELDGVYIDNCDQINVISSAASFCRRGLVTTGGCTGLKFHSLTAEGNIFEDVWLNDVNNCHLAVTTLGRSSQDSTKPRIRIGTAGDVNTKCWAVRVMDGSLSGNPEMAEHPIVSTVGTDRVQVVHDFTHRYTTSTQVIIENPDGHVIRTPSVVSYDSVTNLTTVNVTSGVTANASSIILVGSEATIPLVATSGNSQILVTGDITADHAVDDWIVVKNSTDGDFAAQITAITYNGGTGRTTITVSPTSVNANCTAFQPTSPGEGTAIKAEYVTGLDVVGNSIVNYQNALDLGATAFEVTYQRGRWSGSDTDEIVKHASATWASSFGDRHVAGVASAKIHSLNPTSTQPTVVTLASNAITITESLHKIDTEAGAAADDLDTITWASGTPKAGQFLRLTPNADTHDVTITTAGNIVGPGLPVTFTNRNGFANLRYNSTMAKWVLEAFWAGA